MTIRHSTLRPGLLVGLGTSLTGNVKYDRLDLENDLTDNVERTKWETTREIADVAEFEAAKKAQSKASSIIRGVCVKSKHGLLCPEANREQLDKAISEAEAVIDEFNRTATLTRAEVNVIVGHIASDDEQAMKRINREIVQLIERMREGVANMDVKVIRDAANKARDVGNMVTPEAQVRIQFAVDAARSVARGIVKAGEGAALEVDKLAIRKIMEQRTAFLDLSGPVETAAPDVQTARSIELAPEENNNAV